MAGAFQKWRIKIFLCAVEDSFEQIYNQLEVSKYSELGD